MLRHLVSIALVTVAVSGALRAETGWVLTRADFTGERVDLLAMDDSVAQVRLGDGQTRRVALDDLLMLERVNRAAGPSGNARFVAILSGGGRAAGIPRGISGDNLLWTNPTLGQIALPLRSVRYIVRRGGSTIPNTAARTEDVVILNNKDSVHGILADISESSVTIQQAGGEPTSIPLDSIDRLALATTAAATSQRATGFRVGLADGSVIAVSTLTLDERQVNVVLADGSKRPVPMQAVVSIEHVNGPVVWLSSLTPAESVQKPFLDLAWPARMDQSVTGDPIRFGTRTFERGIGVHSYSRLVFKIEPAMAAFRTQYAVAGDLPYANLTVRIKLDDKVVHEDPTVRTGYIAPPVVVSINGAQTLTLEVDYGQGYDVQDRLNWIEPAFLAKLPTTQPN